MYLFLWRADMSRMRLTLTFPVNFTITCVVKYRKYRS